MSIETAMQLMGSQISLQLSLDNSSSESLSELAIKINSNPFRLQPQNQALPLPSIPNNSTQRCEVMLDCEGAPDNNAPSFPLKIQVALRTQLDVVVFGVPVSLSALLQP